MILSSRIPKRVCKMLEMIAQCNNFIASSPVLHKNPNQMLNPNCVSIERRSFCGYRLLHGVKASLGESTESSMSSLFASRVSRTVRNEAQVVLFDYLHSTRGFSFTDSEHISKNSPNFLQTLLSKVDGETDVSRSLTKFLRYNPINEFEPFFESLGLNPSEFSSFLPRNLMFLSDDSIMFENFNVLCNYGVPRGKIGRMYKEAREIFRYDYGVLSSTLEAYESLGLSKPTVVKLVTYCPSLLVGGVDNGFARILDKLKQLGIESDWIGAYLSDKGTYDWGKILDTIDFLNAVGYGYDQLGSLLKINPALVIGGSGKKVYILFGRLLKVGLKVNDIYSLFINNPELLSDKRAKSLWQALDFLFDIRMETDFIARIVLTNMKLIGSSSLKRPKTVCRSLKVKDDGLRQILKEDPSKLFSLACKSKDRKNETVASQDAIKWAEKMAFLLRLGYVENSDEMVKALKKFRGRGDQLQERFDCLVKAGLDPNVVSSIIKQAPMILNQSKDVIEKKLRCLTDFIGYPIESLVGFPAYLCYDMDRINHRFSMYVWLRERGAAKSTLSLSTMLACSSARFVKYFVDIHPEGPAMWESISKSSASS